MLQMFFSAFSFLNQLICYDTYKKKLQGPMFGNIEKIDV